MLSSTATLLMGDQRISMDLLHQIVSTSSKLFHGLVSSDLNPRDHQNYASCFRISRDEVLQALEGIDNSDATVIYLRLLRSIIDAYIEPSTSLLDRIFHAWMSVFLSRLWLVWIEKMGKTNLDEILDNLTENSNEYAESSKKTAQQYFITPQTVYSIELNAHCLIYLILLVVEGKLPQEVLTIDRFNSQSCEGTFRAARALSSNSSSGVNFTVQQFLNLVDKLSLFQKIESHNEQLSSPQIRFPVHHKNKHGHLTSSESSSMLEIPSKIMIEATVSRAFETAVDYMDRVGIKSFLRKRNLLNILTLSNYAKALFEDRAILDEFSQEINDDDDHEIYVLDDNENNLEEEYSILDYPDDVNVSEPTFRTTRVCDNVPAHLSQSYFKVRINDKYKFIHKSTASWMLTEQNQQLSSDRTRRVTQTN